MAARRPHPLLLGALISLLVVQAAAAALPHLHHGCGSECDGEGVRPAPAPGASKPCLACALHVPVVAPCAGASGVGAPAATLASPPTCPARHARPADRDTRSRAPPRAP